jgi:type VI secretion system protein ImpK
LIGDPPAAAYHAGYRGETMRPDLAHQTLQVLLHGLDLREKVRAGARPSVNQEQAKFKSLLGASNAPAPWGTAAHDPNSSLSPDRAGGGGGEFLGIRYALTCWLDELLIDAGWREWDNAKLELALYRTNVRYHNFWQQDRLGEAIPEAADAKEAFLLCVLLGFRGEMADTPDALKEWVTAAKGRVTRQMGKEPPAPPEQPPVTDVPPLTGIQAFKGMTRWLLLGGLVAIPATVLLLALLFQPR